MPQDDLFRTRQAHEFRVAMIADPLHPSRPWKAKLLILDAKGGVLESCTLLLPPVWEAEAFADAVRTSSQAFCDLTHVIAAMRFTKAIKDWRRHADDLLTGGTR